MRAWALTGDPALGLAAALVRRGREVFYIALGLFIGWLAHRASGSSADLRLFVATGILGGFTTFSAFSLDVANLWQRGDMGNAAVYILTSVSLSIAAVFAGLWLVRVAA